MTVEEDIEDLKNRISETYSIPIEFLKYNSSTTYTFRDAEHMNNIKNKMNTYILTMHNNFTEEDMDYKTFALSEEQAMDAAEDIFDSDWCVRSVREIKEDEYY